MYHFEYKTMYSASVIRILFPMFIILVKLSIFSAYVIAGHVKTTYIIKLILNKSRFSSSYTFSYYLKITILHSCMTFI